MRARYRPQIDTDVSDRGNESVSICVYLWALFLPAKVRGRIEQEVAEQTEGLVNSPLFSRFPPVCSFILAANSRCMDMRGQMLRRRLTSGIIWCGFDLIVGSLPAPKQPEPRVATAHSKTSWVGSDLFVRAG